MPTARIPSATGAVELYYEETGEGTIPVPSLIVVGDQDEPCLEPALFNQHVAEVLASVESGRWGTWKRLPR